MPSYISRSTAGWKFRRAVPYRLRSRLMLTELTKAISPRPYAAAGREARRLSSLADRLFMTASDPTVDEALLRELARNWFQETVRKDEIAIVLRLPDEPGEEPSHSDILKDITTERLARAKLSLTHGMDGWADEEAQDALIRAGLGLQGEELSARLLARMILEADEEAARIMLAKLRLRHSETKPRNPLFQHEGKPVAAKAPPAETAPAVAPVAQTPMFSETFARFVKSKADLTGSGVGQIEQAGALFVAIAGDKQVGLVTKGDVATVADKIRLLPSRYGKGGKWSGTIDQQIAIADLESAPRIDIETVNRHVRNIAMFLRWCEDQGICVAPLNVTRGITKTKKGKRKRDGRVAWTLDQLRQLFASPLWQGHSGRRSEPGSQVTYDARYWAPIVSLHSGCRLEEIAAADVSDFKVEDDVLIFDIRETDDRSVKSIAGERAIPVHEELIRLGFMDYVSDRRSAGDQKLFPELEPGGSDDRFGFNVTKRFAYLRNGLGIVGPDFHSFRHTFATALRDADVAQSVILELIGHEEGHVIGHYLKAPPKAMLKEAVNRVRFPGLGLKSYRPGSL